MSSPQSPGPAWQVIISGMVAGLFRQLQAQASEEGRGEEAFAAFRNVVDRLGRDPATFGEPLYRLPALRMQVRSGAVRPLVVDFAVCEDRPIVVVKGFRLFSRGDA
jgi:hypothetical protein